MKHGSRNFRAEEEESIDGDEIKNEKEGSSKEDRTYYHEFPIGMMKEILQDVVKKNEISGLGPKFVKQFNNLLNEKKFMTEEVKITDKKVMDVVKNMIRKTSIPGPGDELYNDLYKVLVKNLSNDLKETHTNELEAEVTARKLAAWVLTFDEELKNATDKADEEAEKPMPQNPYYYKPAKDSTYNKEDRNVKMYSLSEHDTNPYWKAPGKVVQLKDKDGSQIFVKGLEDGEGNKTLVKKVKNTIKGKEVSSWVVEVADRDDVRSVEENTKLRTGVETSNNSKFRPPATTDEWKTVADLRREEAESWKTLLEYNRNKDKSTDSSQAGINNPNTGQQKNNSSNGSSSTSTRNLLDVADLKKSLKGFQKLENMNPVQENYLINEIKKKSARVNINEEDWRKFLTSAANRKIQSK